MPAIDTGTVVLHYADRGQGGRPVLLLHELGGSSESWAATLPRFAARGRTVAPDLRWAGRSEKPTAPGSIADLADDLAALSDALGVAAWDVVGSALGALVGAVLAMRHPARVRRLAMFAVSDDLGGRVAEYLAERAARVRTVGMRGVADASLANAFPEGFEAERAAYRPIYMGNDPAGFAELSLALSRLRLGPSDWASIRCPVQAGSGARDFIWPPEHGRRVAALIPGARFALLPDAGHFPHMQSPEALANAAIAFLDDGDDR